jgi:micrococcal nuclease
VRLGSRGPSLGAILLLVIAVVALLSGDDGGQDSADDRGRGGADDRGRGGADDRGGDDRRGGAGSAPKPPSNGDESRPRGGPGVTASVVDVVDGDTIEVALDGRVEDVRYIGIDTPESVAPGQPVECFGHRASERNARLVGGERVRLAFDAERRDRYGRLLAYVYLGERFVNGELVEGGYARTLEIEPNTSKAPLLDRLEAEAGRDGRGLWAACGP